MKVEDRNHDAVWFGETCEFIERCEAHIVASVGQGFCNGRFIETSGIGKALATVDDDADTYALRLRR